MLLCYYLLIMICLEKRWDDDVWNKVPHAGITVRAKMATQLREGLLGPMTAVLRHHHSHPFLLFSFFFPSFYFHPFLTLHLPIQVISKMSASKVYVGAYDYRSTLNPHFTLCSATPPRASFGDSSTSLLSYSITAGEGRCSSQQQQKVPMLSSNDA